VVGRSRLVLKKDGTILLSGKDIQIEGSGSVTVKSAGKVIVKGSKVSHN
jgi:type VI secretion system secreted protein VgrG